MTVPMVAWMMHQDDRANGRVVDRGHDLGLPGHDMEHFAVRWSESMTGAACGRSPWEVISSFNSALPNALLAVSRGPTARHQLARRQAPLLSMKVSDLEHTRLALLRQGCSARFKIDLGRREFALGETALVPAIVTAAVPAKLARPAGLGLTARSLTGSCSALSVRGIDRRSVARQGTWPTTTSS